MTEYILLISASGWLLQRKKFHLFFTSGLVWGTWPAARSGRFTAGRRDTCDGVKRKKDGFYEKVGEGRNRNWRKPRQQDLDNSYSLRYTVLGVLFGCWRWQRDRKLNCRQATSLPCRYGALPVFGRYRVRILAGAWTAVLQVALSTGEIFCGNCIEM